MNGDPSVLVVDDEAEIADAYARWLADDCSVTTAHDGREALAAASPETDVVLLDRRMPRLSGDEALQRLRGRGYNVRVAMVTAVDPDFDVVDMPFDTYLTKPLRRDELLETVETLIELADYDDAVREAFVLAEKHAALTAAKPTAELCRDERFAELESELAAARERASEKLGTVDHETVESALSGLSARVDARHGGLAGW